MDLDGKKLVLIESIKANLIGRGYRVGIVNNEIHSINNILLGWRFHISRRYITYGWKSTRTDNLQIYVGGKMFRELKKGGFNIDGIVKALIKLVDQLQKEHGALEVRARNTEECDRIRKLIDSDNISLRPTDVDECFEMVLHVKGETEAVQIANLYAELLCEQAGD